MLRAHFYILNNYINIDLGLIDVYMEKSMGKLFVLNDYPRFVMTLITTRFVDNYSQWTVNKFPASF